MRFLKSLEKKDILPKLFAGNHDISSQKMANA